MSAIQSRLHLQKTELKVLLVDDDKNALEELHDIVEFEGWMPITANSVDSAMALLESDPGIRVVVTDVHFNEPTGQAANGIQLVSRAQAQFHDRELSYIVLSGDIDALSSSVQEGAYDFLSKPLAPESLVAAINHADASGGAEQGGAYVKNFLIERLQSTTKALLDAGGEQPGDKQEHI